MFPAGITTMINETNMIIRKTLEELGEITEKEIEMLERASKKPIVFDEDSPELTWDELRKFRRVGDKNGLERNK